MEHSQIDRILEMNNIVDIISSYFPLKKTGNNYKACCPFHDEKTPSFVVSEKKQIYKCFGCGKGGNAITFVRDYEKISFGEALKKLASRVGIAITTHNVDSQKKNKRDLIHRIYKIAMSFFHQNLKEHGNFASKYLEDRKISKETINKFQIGYALNSYASLKNHLIKNSINQKILNETGLFTANNNDLFRDRLMFPIHDNTGKVIAFGGRVLHENQSGGKYVNSPTTSIYTKGKELYGLNITKYDISRMDCVLICEGYTDFLRLYENDFTNSVASLGTSLTDDQIRLLSRFTKNFVMLYDGDNAGVKAALRAASNITKHGFTVKIVSFENDEDPDGFLQKFGAKKLEIKISSALTLIEFLKKDTRLKLNEQTKLTQLIEIINEFEDAIARDLFIKEISDKFGVHESSIFSKIRKNTNRQNANVVQETIDRFEAERNLLILLINRKIEYKNVAQKIDSSYYFSNIYRSIFEFLNKNNEYMGNMSNLIDEIKDEMVQNKLSELIISEIPNLDSDKVLSQLQYRKLNQQLVEINKKIKMGKSSKADFAEKQKIKKELMKINKKVVSKTLY